MLGEKINAKTIEKGVEFLTNNINFYNKKLIEKDILDNKIVDKINKEKDLTKEQKAIASCMIYGGDYYMGMSYVEGCKEFKKTGTVSYMKLHRY